MTALIDGATKTIQLVGDNMGWQRCKIALNSPPSGANSALYICEVNGLPDSSISTTIPAWDAAYYWGLSFDGNHIETPATNGQASFESAFSNFFGMFACNYTLSVNSMTITAAQYSSSSTRRACLYVDNNYTTDETGLEMRVMNGNGASIFPMYHDQLTSSPFTRYHHNSAADATAFLPQVYDYGGVTWSKRWSCFWIRKSPEDNRVLLDAWITYIDPSLVSLDSITDDNPKATLLESDEGKNNTTNYELQSDTFGTNWMPTDGDMAFPTHFLARWPFVDGQLNISYLAVKYATLTT